MDDRDKDEANSQLARYLLSVHGIDVGRQKTFLCPICGKCKNTPCCSYFVDDKGTPRLKCHSCSFFGDLFAVVGHDIGAEGPSRFPEQAAELRRMGILRDSSSSLTPAPPSPQSTPKVESEPKEIEKPAPEYLALCERRLFGAADYIARRGLTLETCRRFGVGFNPGYRYAPRLVVPNDAGGALMRDVRGVVPEAGKDFTKLKYGPAGLFNLSALEWGQPVFTVEGEVDAMSIE